jgi:ferredoxin
MKIEVDPKRCELHGRCAFVAPELFCIENDTLIVEASVPEELRQKAETAAKVCPQLAIRLVEDGK